MKIQMLLLVLLFCFQPAYAAHAEVFRYFDEEGTLIVTDDPFGTNKRDRQQYHKKQNRSNKVRHNFREDVYYEFYEVSGTTIHEVMGAIERLGPYNFSKGRSYAGQTQWNFGLSYNLDFSYYFDSDNISVSLQISDIDFRSDITVVLPALSDTSSLEAPDFSAWEEFLRLLTEHEHDHVRIIQEPRFRQKVFSGISGIRELTLPNLADGYAEATVKAAIESAVNAVAHDGMRKIKQKNDEYDTVTDHGRKPELSNAFFQGL